jgi:hypothetical protein
MANRLPKKLAGKAKRKETTGRKTVKKTAKSKTWKSLENLYTLTVYIIGGPISEEYEGKVTARTIQIKGSQTLATLHEAIFAAFDREEEHLYEFNLGIGPYDRSKIYSLQTKGDEFDDDEESAGEVRTTTIDDLELKVGRAFGYAFDFGDDWQHQINVEAIEPAPATGTYPKVTKRIGDSPPQYPDLDEEDEE